MTRPQVIHVASVAELRSLAALWDDLWWRSDVTTPALRAELITLWMEHFAPRRSFMPWSWQSVGIGWPPCRW